MAGHSGRNGRIEPFDKLCELFGHASVVVVGMAADEVDHLAIALGRLPAVAARLVDHSEAIPAIVHVGEADQQVARGCLGLVELGGAVALALMADCALAAEMPEDFQGTWCTSSDTLKDDWSAYNTEGADCEGDYSSVEITATTVKSPALSVSCVVRKVTKFDVCPSGMIFRNRERARALRPFQINPWSPGYHIVLQCTSGSKQSETMGRNVPVAVEIGRQASITSGH